MSSVHVNSVLVIDALPEGELGTARRLRDDLESLSAAFAEGLAIQYSRVHSHSDFLKLGEQLYVDARDAGLKPALHIEAHGLPNETGLLLPSGESFTWSELKELCTPINVQTGLNLLVVLAACYGGSFTTSLRTTEPAPVWGLVGPTRELSAGEIERDFAAFYAALLRTNSGADAIRALNSSRTDGLYFRTTAEKFFYDVWLNYKLNQCTPRALDERAKDLRKRALRELGRAAPSRKEFRRQISARVPEFFAQYAATYFMHSAYPENAERFPVSYKRAETFLKAYRARQKRAPGSKAGRRAQGGSLAR